MLALTAQLGVDLLSAAEARQPGQRGRQGLRLFGPARPGTARRPDLHVVLRLRFRHSRTVQRESPSLQRRSASAPARSSNRIAPECPIELQGKLRIIIIPMKLTSHTQTVGV